MKKILFLTTAAMLTILLSSCADQYYVTEEYITEECDHDYAAMDTYNFEIYPDEWQAGDDGSPFLYVTKSLSAITDNVIENGITLSYFVDADGRDNILPYIRPWDLNEYNEPYSQYIRCDMEAGYITFIVEASDLAQAGYPEGNMFFKVVVMQNYYH